MQQISHTQIEQLFESIQEKVNLNFQECQEKIVYFADILQQLGKLNDLMNPLMTDREKIEQRYIQLKNQVRQQALQDISVFLSLNFEKIRKPSNNLFYKNQEKFQALSQDIKAIDLNQIQGMENVKETLLKNVILPLKLPMLFKQEQNFETQSILLYGAAGTGKSYMMRAISNQLSCLFPFFHFYLSSLYTYERENVINEVELLFQMAGEWNPIVLYIDELDYESADIEQKPSIKTYFEQLLQKVKNNPNVILIGGTQLVPNQLHPLILQLFKRQLFTPLPDYESRKSILQKQFTSENCNLEQKDYEEFSKLLDGFTPSDIICVGKDVLMNPIRVIQSTNKFLKIKQENGGLKYQAVEKSTPVGSDVCEMNLMDLKSEELIVPLITKKDVLEIIQKTKPSIPKEMANKFIEYNKNLVQ